MIVWLLKAILFFVIIRVIWWFLSGLIDGLTPDAPGSRGARGGSGSRPGARGNTASVPLVRDPVCGKYVVPGRAITTGRADQIQYFCSEKCRDEFARRA
jgi:YHS domain-containing protein